MVEEKILLTRAFVTGRDLKRKYETMREFEKRYGLEPHEVIDGWLKSQIIGAFADVREDLMENRPDLREKSALTPQLNRKYYKSIDAIIK